MVIDLGIEDSNYSPPSPPNLVNHPIGGSSYGPPFFIAFITVSSFLVYFIVLAFYSDMYTTPSDIGVGGRYLNDSRKASGRGSGSPLMRAFAGSKPLPSASSAFLSCRTDGTLSSETVDCSPMKNVVGLALFGWTLFLCTRTSHLKCRY